MFTAGQVLPGNVGRAMLGPFADQRAVDALNHEMGTDRPLLVQYGDWVARFAQGDMGRSYAYRAPVAPFVGTALANSAKLAAVAFLLVVPFSLFMGVLAALHVGQAADRIIMVAGMSATIVPEFVSGIILILIFGVWLRWLPISATWPPGSGFFGAALSFAPAVHSAGAHSVRLYCAHGTGRNHRSARCRLYAHGGAQGIAARRWCCGGTFCAMRCCRR